MTLAEHKIDLAQRLLALNNKKLLRAIDLLISQDEEDAELTERQKRDLDRRIKEVEGGSAKLFSWEETKRIVRHKK